MNKKKLIYGAIALIVLVLGYLNYFGEEKDIKEIKKVVETKNAIYESEDYYVEAEKELDYIDEKESIFEKAKARIKGMLLTGDNVFLDKARNLILKSNIVGISPNGWKINASELKYEKESDMLISENLVSAINEEQGIEISGNKFKTNINMDHIILEDRVVIKNKYMSLLADRAEYSNETKHVVLKGNISIIGFGAIKKETETSSDTEKEKIENNKLSGNFNEVYYNLDERNLYASNGFEATYDNITLIGDNLVLNDRDENFKVTGNVKVKYQDYLFNLESIEKKTGSQVIEFLGNINGGNEIYSLKADNGSYDLDSKVFSITGNIDLVSKNFEQLKADKLTYNLDSKDINVIGNLAKYTSPTYNLEAEDFIYNTETKLVSTDKRFYAFNEKKQSIRGTDLRYNLLTKDFSAVNNLALANKDYEINGKNINYKEETALLTIPEDFELRSLTSDLKVLGKTVTYNKLSGDLISDNELNLFSKTTKVNGKNFTYNSNTGLGKVEGPISLEDKEENMTGSAKEVLIKTGDNIEVVGPINVNQNGTIIDTEKLVYKYSDNLLHMPNIVSFKDNKGMSGKVLRGTYDPNKAILRGYNFDMKEPTRSAKADEIIYYTNQDKLELLKNVVLVSDKNNIKTQNLEYNTSNSDIILKTASTIVYDNYLIKSNSAKLNNKTGELYVKNVNITSSDNSEFSANETKGNINDGLIHFTGNVKSTVYDNKGEKTNFNGEMLDLYLEKIGDNYKAKKLIMNKPGVFTQLNRKLETDDLEADLVKNIVYAKNRPILTVDNGEKGNTIGKANTARAHLDSKILYLDGDVYVKDVNENKEEIVMTSKRAEIKDNIASAYDKVKVVNKDSTVTANEGHYDTTTKKVRLKGNVHVDYLTKEGVKK